VIVADTVTSADEVSAAAADTPQQDPSQPADDAAGLFSQSISNFLEWPK